MKKLNVTEFVKFKTLDSTSENELIAKADSLINDFQKPLPGFVNAELVKAVEGNTWYIIYHYRSLEDIHKVGEKIRSSKEFKALMPLLDSGSLEVSFFTGKGLWQ